MTPLTTTDISSLLAACARFPDEDTPEQALGLLGRAVAGRIRGGVE